MDPKTHPGLALDLHADTLSRILEEGLQARAFLEGPELSSGGEGRALQATLPGMRTARLDGLVLAAFVQGPGGSGGSRPARRAVQAPSLPAASPYHSSPLRGLRAGLEMAVLLREIEIRSEGAAGRARSLRELLENRSRGAASLILSLENSGDATEGNLRALEVYRELGARIGGLVWYARNPFGSGVGEGSDGEGLSRLGREAVREMERLGIAVDVSHLNRTGVRDVLREAKGPVLATHSNARALCDHPRNLDDDQIREIASRGGIVGLCLFPKFLRDPARGIAAVEDAVRHLEHMAQVGGIGCIASGSDFDGFTETAEGLAGLADLPRIAGALRTRGWSEPDVAAYRGGNALRVMGMLGD